DPGRRGAAPGGGRGAGRDAPGHRAVPLPSRPGPIEGLRTRPRRRHACDETPAIGRGCPAAVRTVTSAVREFDRRVEPGLALLESAQAVPPARHATAAPL